MLALFSSKMIGFQFRTCCCGAITFLFVATRVAFTSMEAVVLATAAFRCFVLALQSRPSLFARTMFKIFVRQGVVTIQMFCVAHFFIRRLFFDALTAFTAAIAVQGADCIVNVVRGGSMWIVFGVFIHIVFARKSSIILRTNASKVRIRLARPTIDTEQMPIDISSTLVAILCRFVLTVLSGITLLFRVGKATITMVQGIAIDLCFDTLAAMKALAVTTLLGSHFAELSMPRVLALAVLEDLNRISANIEIVQIVFGRSAQFAMSAILTIHCARGHLMFFEFTMFSFVRFVAVTSLSHIWVFIVAQSSIQAETRGVPSTIGYGFLFTVFSDVNIAFRVNCTVTITVELLVIVLIDETQYALSSVVALVGCLVAGSVGNIAGHASPTWLTKTMSARVGWMNIQDGSIRLHVIFKIRRTIHARRVILASNGSTRHVLSSCDAY
mmetsp:Transcript_26445/g.73011  ORF Transcript_26445/g.73011 Transcript_26445/m.73011 type:complete len:441 (+) Transcript_26445:782-2104(+)